jgi:hypothetical protein
MLAAAVILGLVAAFSLVFFIPGCGSDEGTSTDTSTARTATGKTATIDTVSTTGASTAAPTVRTVTVTAPPAPSPAPSGPAAGPYTTQAAAVSYVESLGEAGSPMMVLDPSSTWRAGADLHVIHSTISGSASYAGDFYYFFADGNLVGQEYFTYGAPGTHPDTSTFVVDFQVFNPGDPHCCPSGGTASVRFHWNGSILQTLDPMTGAEMS